MKEIKFDEYPTDPREDDNLCIIVNAHKKYVMGDKNFTTQEQVDVYEKTHRKNLAWAKKWGLVEKIFIYDRSGIALSLRGMGNWPDQHWDAGQLGFMYIDKDTMDPIMGRKRMTKKFAEKMKDALTLEFSTWRGYHIGDTYFVEDEDGSVYTGTYADCEDFIEGEAKGKAA